MLLSIPLIAKDGTVYGICGLEVSDMQFKSMYSPRSPEYHRVFTALALMEDGNFDTRSGLIAGNFYLTSQTIGLLTPAGENDGIRSWFCISNGGIYKGRTEMLRLYPADSPYVNETWAVSLLLPAVDWDSSLRQGNAVFYGAVSALLMASLVAAVFISRRYIRPVVAALDLVKLDGRNKPQKTQITEIDDFFKYLDAMDEERKTLTAELERMKLKATDDPSVSPGEEKTSEVNVPVFKAYEQFSSNLETLTTTERAVFNLYLRNLGAQQIADKLFVSINTIKFHNKNIYSKLKVSSLKELKVYISMMEGMPMSN
jgi:DNA-binding NarL/FixJ family response regulator